mgnify:FL=1
MVVLLQMIFNGFRRSYEYTVDYAPQDGENALEMNGYEQMAYLTRNYVIWQSLNAWLIGLRILFDFGFSRELSLVLELINEALLDILFFVLMFFIVSIVPVLANPSRSSLASPSMVTWCSEQILHSLEI